VPPFISVTGFRFEVEAFWFEGIGVCCKFHFCFHLCESWQRGWDSSIFELVLIVTNGTQQHRQLFLRNISPVCCELHDIEGARGLDKILHKARRSE
jgi:hypothetical protein